MMLFAYPGYVMSPGYISDTVNKLTGGNASHSMTSSFLSQMGIPSVDEMIDIAHYSFIGLGIAGLGLTIYGAVTNNSKNKIILESIKTNSSVAPNSSDKSNTSDTSSTSEMPKALWLLQERLAKGEITSRQFKNLRRLLEEQN